MEYSPWAKINKSPKEKHHLVHEAGKPESWYATRGSKGSATALANKLNRSSSGKKYEVSPKPWNDVEEKAKGGKISTAEHKNPKHKGW